MDDGIQVIQLTDPYHDSLLMVWPPHPTRLHTIQAFDDIKQHLENGSNSVCIVVDLRANPQFQLAATFNQAMEIQSHPNLNKWLVIGGSGAARFIGRSISAAVKNNIEWFDTEDEAYARLDALLNTE